MPLNPYTDDEDYFAQTAAFPHPIFRGTVVSTLSDSGPDGRGHAVTVSPEHTEETLPAIVSETVDGDVAIPSNGTDVLCVVGQNRTAYVIQTVYSTSDDVQTVQTGARELGHPDSASTVRFAQDGTVTVTADSGATVTVSPDGTVTINGGTNRPITDITTTTDADGHVTSVDVTRTDDLYVP